MGAVRDNIYAAGIVDGEGYLGIYSSLKDKKHTKPTFGVKVGVGNTNKSLIEWLSCTFGGHFHLQKAPKVEHKDCYKWEITNKLAFQFIHRIYPYLKIKNKQALLILKFEQLLIKYGIKSGWVSRKSKYNVARSRFNELQCKCRKLNRRGKPS